MADKIMVILNTRGGRLSKQAKIAVVERALQTAGLEYHLELTENYNHGVELALQANLNNWPIIVAAGGDGTINAVVNGIMQATGQKPASTLAILPLGTANDLADVLKLPSDLTQACRRIAAGHTRVIDVGVVNGRYFANNSAVGLEPVITQEHDRMRRVKGNLRYILAALKGIINSTTWSMRLTWDTGMYEGPTTLVSVGNSNRTGGSFFMTPKATVDDGLLDFTYASGMSRWQMLRLLPKTFTGNHIDHPLVVCLKTTSLSITTLPATPIQADGELFEQTATEINYQILPQKLQVIV